MLERRGLRVGVGGAVVAALLVSTAPPAMASTPGARVLSREQVVELARSWAGQSSGEGAASGSTPDARAMGTPDPSVGEGTPPGPEAADDLGLTGEQTAAALSDFTTGLLQLSAAPDGYLAAGEGGTVTADDLGVTATFSGHEVDADLVVRVDDLPGTPAARSARGVDLGPGLPDDGIVLVDPFEVVATDSDGRPVTSFPASSRVVERTDAESPETDVDVVPGLRLDVEVDLARVERAGVDAGMVRLFTRPTGADEWTQVPSVLDAASGVVWGEVDHLSQFVVIGTPNDPDPKPRIVLDPDNDVAQATAPGGAPVSELPYNMQLATGLRDLFSAACVADVTLTRDGSTGTVSRDLRAAIARAANPSLMLTIGFNSFGDGSPGGSESGGGSRVYFRDDPLSVDAGIRLNDVLPGYTGRPSQWSNVHGTLPYAEYAGLPGAKVHLEALHLNHNYDWPVISGGFPHLVNGVFTGLGQHLESQGFNCTDYFGGGWPDRPSAAELARWRLLGHMNYLVYGADPVSFSTGNLFEDEPLFTLPGPGGTDTEVTLFYNSQDGRATRTGAGWSFDLGGRAQRFSDGSVMVVRGDGASFVYEPNGTGGFTPDPGNTSTLREISGGRLEQTDADGTKRVFDTSDLEGIGELVSVTDRQGNTTRLTYGTPDGDDAFVPLTAITDAAGQTITVTNDGAGRITGFTLPDGRTWGLGYDAAGDLVVITNPDGRTRTFTYDGQHRMLTATDAAGVRYLRNVYDGAGRVIEQFDAEDNRRTWTYHDTPGADGLRRVVYTDNEGKPSTYWFDAKYRVVKTQDTAGRVERFTYDGADRQTTHTDAEGRVTSYTYDGAGNIATETGPDGQVKRYTYDGAGQVTSVTDPGGVDGADRTTTWNLTPAGLVASVVFADGTASTATYNAAGDITSETDPAGNTTTYAYDTRGNVTSSTDPTGAVTTFTYDAANRLIGVTDPNGAVTAYTWDAGDRLVAQTNPDGGVVHIAYDANDHPVTVTDPTGAVTAYTWDALFRLTSVSDPAGGVTTYEYNSEDVLVAQTNPDGGRVVYELDDAYQPVTVIDPNGGAWQVAYDQTGSVVSETTPTGQVTSYTYDDAGRVESVTDPTGATTAYAYDAVGRVVAVVDPTGAVEAYEYDVMDQVTSVTDPAGGVTTYEYDTAGDLVSVTDRRGNTWSREHDAAGRLVAEVNPLGERTQYGYDPAGNLTSVTDPVGATTTYAYDVMGQVLGVTDANGHTATTEYDLAGRVLAQTAPTGATTSFGYDPAGRLTTVTDASGGVETYTYDQMGNQTGYTDANDNPATYAYDLAGQLVAVTEADGTDSAAVTRYGYDADGNLTRVTDARGGVTELAYDGAGRVASETNPVGVVFTSTYDGAGRLTRAKDGNGQVTRYAYDPRGLLTQTRYADGSVVDLEYDAEEQPIAMTDPAGATAWGYDRAGRMTRQTDTHGADLTYDYDEAGNVTTLTLPSGQQVTSAYDLVGNLVGQHTPWGDLTYTYDSAGRLTAQARNEADGSPGVVSTYGYDETGRVRSIAHHTPAADTPPVTSTGLLPESPDGVVAVGAADVGCTAAGQYLAGRTIPEGGAGTRCTAAADYLASRDLPAPEPVAANGDGVRVDYTYDPAGNVTSTRRSIGTVPDATEPLDGESTPLGSDGALVGPMASTATDYTYDELGRLTRSTTDGVTTGTYEYDPTGNRTAWTTTNDDVTTSWAATYDPAHRLTGARVTQGTASAQVTYANDGNGARTWARATGDQGLAASMEMSATYDASGRLTEYASGDASTTYTRDGLGRAVTTSTETVTGTLDRAWTFDGLAPVFGEGSDDAQVAFVRDQLANMAIQTDQRLSGTLDGETRWGLVDALGSIIAEAAAGAGAITQAVSYSDYGATSLDTTGWGSHLGYSGQLTDLDTGTVNYHQRLYDPTTGTWTTHDTWRGLLHAPATLNGFAFLTGNPTSKIDVLGYAGMLIDGKWGSPAAFKASQAAKKKAPTAPVQTKTKQNTPKASTPSAKKSPKVVSQSKAKQNKPSVAVPKAKSSAVHGTSPLAQAQHDLPGWAKGIQLWLNAAPSLAGLTWARMAGATCSWNGENFLLVCQGATRFTVKGGTALGNVFVTSSSSADYTGGTGWNELLKHEAAHTAQWSSFSPGGMALAYLLLYAIQGECNTLERAAGFKGGNYAQCL